MAPTLVTTCTTLPPEGVYAPALWKTHGKANQPDGPCLNEK